jgi:hypothetical protein
MSLEVRAEVFNVSNTPHSGQSRQRATRAISSSRRSSIFDGAQATAWPTAEVCDLNKKSLA